MTEHASGLQAMLAAIQAPEPQEQWAMTIGAVRARNVEVRAYLAELAERGVRVSATVRQHLEVDVPMVIDTLLRVANEKREAQRQYLALAASLMDAVDGTDLGDHALADGDAR